MEQRLLDYAKHCLLVGRALCGLNLEDARHIGKQLIRSGSHPGIHYGEARAAESRRDFAHKLGVLLKELRESHNTLRLVVLMDYFPPEKLQNILREGNELIAMMTATVKKLRNPPK